MRPWRCLPQGWLSRQGGLTPAPRPPPAAARVSGAGGSAIRPRSLSAASLAAPPAANAQPGPGAEIGQSPRPPPAPLGAVGGGGGAGPPSPLSPGDPRVWGGWFRGWERVVAAPDGSLPHAAATGGQAGASGAPQPSGTRSERYRVFISN